MRIFLAVILLNGFLWSMDFKVDKVHSKVSFKIKHMLITNVVGSINDFSGSFKYDKTKDEVSNLYGKAMIESIDTDNKKRDKHLLASDFLDAKKYPSMEFTMTKFTKDSVEGTLKIKGIEKNIVFEYIKGGLITDNRGNERFGFSMEGSISRKDFNIQYNRLMESGGLVVGDEVKITIDIQGIEK